MIFALSYKGVTVFERNGSVSSNLNPADVYTSFDTPGKHQKPFCFSDVFRRYRKRLVARNGLTTKKQREAFYNQVTSFTFKFFRVFSHFSHMQMH